MDVNEFIYINDSMKKIEKKDIKKNNVKEKNYTIAYNNKKKMILIIIIGY